MKRCAKCEQHLPKRAFYVRRGAGCGLSSHCKACTRARTVQYGKAHPEVRRVISRRNARTLGCRYRTAQSIAKCAGWCWRISELEYAWLAIQPCHYCGFPLTETGVGLDRKDNSIGYEVVNVVPCCRECNVAKNRWFTYSEMLIIGEAIRVVKLNRLECKD